MLQGKLYSLGAKISDLSAVVRRKRMELEYLKRIKTLTTIVENQVRLKFDTYFFFCFVPNDLWDTFVFIGQK